MKVILNLAPNSFKKGCLYITLFCCLPQFGLAQTRSLASYNLTYSDKKALASVDTGREFLVSCKNNLGLHRTFDNPMKAQKAMHAYLKTGNATHCKVVEIEFEDE